MIQAQGLHVALPARDLAATVSFYTRLFGMKVLYHTTYHGANFVMLEWQGAHRVSFLERPGNIPSPPWVSTSGENPLHIGFTVKSREEVDCAARVLREEGVEIIIGPRDRNEVHEHAVYCLDPNGYQVEIYCEKAGIGPD